MSKPCQGSSTWRGLVRLLTRQHARPSHAGYPLPFAPQRGEGREAIWWDALLPFLGTRLTLILVGLLASFYVLPLTQAGSVPLPRAADSRLPDALWLMWQRFDSGFYLDIAREGYWSTATLRHQSNWVFYPLFPLLIRPIGHLLGGSSVAFSVAGVLVANAAALIAVAYLYVLVRREFGGQIASRTVMYIALFPTSFYLSAVYAEPVLLACCVACIYYMRAHRWWLAGACGGLAALTRAQGIVLIVPLAWEVWYTLSNRNTPANDVTTAHPWIREARTWGPGLALLLVPAGLLAFMLYAKLKTGDLLATYHNEHEHWGRHLVYPWRVLIWSLRHPQGANPNDWNFWILNIVVTLAFLACTTWAFRKLPMTYALCLAMLVLLPLSSNLMNSMSRFCLIAFPAFIVLALWSSESVRFWRHHFVMSFFASVQAVFMLCFVLGLPAIA